MNTLALDIMSLKTIKLPYLNSPLVIVLSPLIMPLFDWFFLSRGHHNYLILSRRWVRLGH